MLKGFAARRAVSIATALLTVGGIAVAGAEPAAAAVSGCADNVRWTTGTTTSTPGAFGDGTTITMTVSATGTGSGALLDADWATIDGTDDAFTLGVDSRKSVVVYGAAGGGTTVTMSFGGTVTNPVVFMNYLEGSSLSFTQSITLLDSSPTAAVSGSTVTISGSNGVNDGLAVQVNGTFGSATPLVFTYTTTPTGDTALITLVKPGGTGGECDTPPYTTEGYFEPVDTGRTLNTVKGGSVLPLKFRVYDGETLMTDPSIIRFTAVEVSCASIDTVFTDPIEYTVAGATTLRWDGNQFIHNWRIPRTKGKCYRVSHLPDGADGPTAVFATR